MPESRVADILCCKTAERREQERIDRHIRDMLKKWDSFSDFKLLLLGTGEVGKSTIIKQMQIIHSQHFQDDKHRRTFIRAVRENILEAMGVLLLAMGDLGIPLADPRHRSHAEVIKKEFRKPYHSETAQRLLTIVGILWEDGGVRECYRRRHEFPYVYLHDSAKYFFNRIDVIADAEYIPTEQDILRVRQSSTGIQEYTFEIEKEVFFRVIDVGGQRTERRKWIHCFDNVTAIIFVAALSDYDQTLLERDPHTGEKHNVNRMAESLALFNVIIHEKYLQHASIILFLNKTDIFEEKIQERHLVDYFPRYATFQPSHTDTLGPQRDAEAGKEFILRSFEAYVKCKQTAATRECFDRGGGQRAGNGRHYSIYPEQQPLYSHFTCATDTEGMKKIIQDVEDYYLQLALIEYNFQ
ncbi:guanine nucleotide-binding protein G(q) subunit alpha-like [Paramacrobiotus metropolitanus]|uniref:guanine nucleotide-binding protein G(q) subunit alpha-like n=1 Tax=Paramacrobiotus metropolitanus TaxID=2943436 RepID=UPI00244585A8|nr:guanine nucleotide-binding protein G(q) subunit alpha-like [Paramacrobiotus metropolitanus]